MACIRLFLLLSLLLGLLSGPSRYAIGADSITRPDSIDAVGAFSSLVLDTAGFPVVSYYDDTNDDLKLMHCNDVNCASNDESITRPDTTGEIGSLSSLVLDAAGFPIVSYWDAANNDLKLMHCNDPNCGGSDESITSPDTAGEVGQYPSLALDTAGFPVVSYHDGTNGDLKLLHCNDPNCSGNDEGITSPDTTNEVGLYSSLELDSDGFPVIAYYDTTTGDLKLLHCNDVNCIGNNESITSPDTVGGVGSFPSLALNANGFPVVSYWDSINVDLKLLHCNDANCTGNNESITSPDTTGEVGQFSSLALDMAGFPVVGYWDSTNGDLKLLHCNDASCTGNNESITSPDITDRVGVFPSLVLDANGFPVISHFANLYADLKLLHCNDASCIGNQESPTKHDATDDVGWYTSLALDANGFPVVSYYNNTKGVLKLMHCKNAQCTGNEESITSPDPAVTSGFYTSLVLDAAGFPVVSYYDNLHDDLKLLHCNDPNCSGNDESITSPITTGVGFPSLLLDANGFPVITSGVKILHCNDPNCSGNDESITSPDMTGGGSPSLVLDANGFPVVSYGNGNLKLLHCNDANCSGNDESITLSGNAGGDTSLVLDANGFPVVSYTEVGSSDLKLLHCNDANCSDNDESITTLDSAVYYLSLALDAAGFPVISYYDSGDLKLLHCDDANCASNNESITSPDTIGDVGLYTSLVLDEAGFPIVSYYDETNRDLKLYSAAPTTATPTNTPSSTPSSTPTLTLIPTTTATATSPNLRTATPTLTPTSNSTATATFTTTPSSTSTLVPTPQDTLTATATNTPIAIPTNMPTPITGATMTPTTTSTPVGTSSSFTLFLPVVVR